MQPNMFESYPIFLLVVGIPVIPLCLCKFLSFWAFSFDQSASTGYQAGAMFIGGTWRASCVRLFLISFAFPGQQRRNFNSFGGKKPNNVLIFI